MPVIPAALLALSTPPPPPIVVTTESRPGLVAFRAGVPRCGEVAASPLVIEDPRPAALFAASAGAKPQPVRLRFRIDATGRPLGIRTSDNGASYPDVPAAFAAWRFTAGEEKADCQIDFAVEMAPVAEAELAAVQAFLALPGPEHSDARRAAFERAKPEGDCFDTPRPNVRLRAYPAFETIPQPPGTLSYSFVEFDIGADGRPRNARIAGSDGNAELDRQALAAAARSRFQPLAKTGCNYPYHRRQPEPLKAPEAPSSDSFRPAGSTCPDDQGAWAYRPTIGFPSEFNRRGIEGWAMIGYDLAPWGATGNVRVLASEPAEAFGSQAVRIVSQSRRSPGSGHVGCTTLVRFVLPPGGSGEGG